MSDAPLTPAEECAVAGTPQLPAGCDRCGRYSMVFNRCTNCGNDERAKWGCEHRIGQGGDICTRCRQQDIKREQLERAVALSQDVEKLDALLSLVDEFCALKLVNNRERLLRLQVRTLELIGTERT